MQPQRVEKSASGGLFRQNTFPLLANIGVLRAGRAQPLYLLTPAGRFALRATAHRADASLRCPKPCAAAQKSERCECPKGTRNAPRSNTLLSCMTHKRRGHPPPGGAAPLLFKKHYHWKDPRFSRPFGRSQRSTGFAAGSAAVLRLFLHQAAFLAPFGRSQRSQQRIQPPSVRRKDGPYYSERSKGRDPLT